MVAQEVTTKVQYIARSLTACGVAMGFGFCFSFFVEIPVSIDHLGEYLLAKLMLVAMFALPFFGLLTWIDKQVGRLTKV